MAHDLIQTAILEAFIRMDDDGVTLLLEHMKADELKDFLIVLVGLANRVSSEMIRGKGE